MKKYVLFLLAVCVSLGANAAGVVLSDTSIDDDYSVSNDVSEEPFVAPQSSHVDNYADEQIQPVSKNSLLQTR